MSVCTLSHHPPPHRRHRRIQRRAAALDIQQRLTLFAVTSIMEMTVNLRECARGSMAEMTMTAHSLNLRPRRHRQHRPSIHMDAALEIHREPGRSAEPLMRSKCVCKRASARGTRVRIRMIQSALRQLRNRQRMSLEAQHWNPLSLPQDAVRDTIRSPGHFAVRSLMRVNVLENGLVSGWWVTQIRRNVSHRLAVPRWNQLYLHQDAVTDQLQRPTPSAPEWTTTAEVAMLRSAASGLRLMTPRNVS